MIELWAGLECTVNRVGDRYHDQLIRTGHDRRLDDIDRIAALGVGAVRYPVLWERTMPTTNGTPNWVQSDAALGRLRAFGLVPIVGLLHHGSGPRDTSLLDPAFPEALATYAHAVARRYPWVTMWTPVNEPLTTARFAGLYGHWYPHATDDRSFVTMVVNECRGIVLALKRIREVNPHAQYVHTDDGGTVYATPTLQYQADFENRRRDIALDLLCGRVDDNHPLAGYLLHYGLTDRDMAWFAEHATPPDVIGIDYYVTSDRYLDDDVARYEPSQVGGNGRDSYVDVTAAQHMDGWTTGFAAMLRRHYEKYNRSVALTEVHLGCTREEQLRWLHEGWMGARDAERQGADVRAVTSWALFGAYDWDALVTRESGSYESGAFDVRGSVPRPTAVAQAITSLATTGTFNHPVLAQPGWWAAPNTRMPSSTRPVTSKRVLIFGANGTLGDAFRRVCETRGITHLALTRAEVDITEPMEVRRAVAACRPWAVVNATGFVNVDGAEHDADECHRVNVTGAVNIAEACMRTNAQLVTFSTDLVFDGARDEPYDETHAVAPVNIYGRSKAEMERQVMEQMPGALVVRTSAFFGPWDRFNFVTRTLAALALGVDVHCTSHVVSPTYVPALVDATLDLLIDRVSGIWHLCNQGATSWVSLARYIAQLCGYSSERILECEAEQIGWCAPRPHFSAMTSRRGLIMPTLEASLQQYLSMRGVPAGEPA